MGDGDLRISRVGNLDSAGLGDIAYVDDEKFFELGKTARASCLIVTSGYLASLAAPAGNKPEQALIEVPRPKLAFALIAALLHPPKRREPFVHPSAVIAESADVDLTVFVGAHVAIGERSRIGAGTRSRGRRICR